MNIDLSLIGTYAVGIITLIIVAKLILAPFKLLLTLIWNALLGGALLWGVNYIGAYVGFTLAINWISALIAGFLGIPGVILLIIWKLFF
jgi:inhibitor of the pro-sigma K processing machinery